jgi:hypothetical protein
VILSDGWMPGEFKMIKKTLLGVITGTALFLQAGASYAQLLPNCTLYQNSTVPVNCTTGATPTVLSTPAAYSYSDTTLQPASASGGIITGSTYPTGYTGASFYDAFVVQVTNSSGDSISSTINLGTTFQITNFQERLYSYTGNAPIVGAVAGALDAWTYPAGSSGTVAVLPSTFLKTGTYVIEVRGDVTGTQGGSYSGTFQLAPPVPLPAAGWLLVSGVGGLLGFARRRLQH